MNARQAFKSEYHALRVAAQIPVWLLDPVERYGERAGRWAAWRAYLDQDKARNPWRYDLGGSRAFRLELYKMGKGMDWGPGKFGPTPEKRSGHERTRIFQARAPHNPR